MGRPRGSKNKNVLLRMGKIKAAPDTRSDNQIIDEIKARFDIFYRMIVGSFQDSITALIVSGSAGVGKSYTAEWALDRAKQANGIRYRIVRGTISALELYCLAYELNKERDVIVLDDADRIFDDEEGLNILKTLLDTSIERKVSWLTDHPRFKGEDALPKDYVYKGSMIFLTNRNFQEYIDNGTGRHVEHMNALMSRSIYLDLKMHTRREVSLWAKHLVIRNGILQQLGLTKDQEQMVMDWLIDNRDKLREMSIRTAIKLGKIYKMNASTWEMTAQVLLLKEKI
jgi:hypothetical protein